MKDGKIYLSFLLGAMLAILYAVFLYWSTFGKDFKITLELLNDEKGSKDIVLYYDLGDGFFEERKTRFIEYENKYTAFLEFNEEVHLRTIRLDLIGNDTVYLNKLTYYKGADKIISEEDSETLTNIILDASNGVSLKKLNKGIEVIATGRDPHLVFRSLFFTKFSPSVFSFLFLSPLFFLLCSKLVNKHNQKPFSYDVLFLGLLICSIPLKNSLTSFAVIVILCYSLVLCLKNKTGVKFHYSMIMAFVFLYPVLYGVLGGVYENFAITLGAIVFPLAMSFIKPSQVNLRSTYQFYSRFVLGLGFFVLAVFFMYWVIGEVSTAHLFPNTDKIGVDRYFLNLKYRHPTFLGIFLLIGFVLKWFEAKRNTKPSIIELSSYFLVVLLYGVITMSRIVIFGSLVTLILLITLKKVKALYFILVICLSAFSLFMAYQFFGGVRTNLMNLMLQNDRWLFGNGLNSSNLAALEEFGKASHPHNQFLLWFYEFGFVGAVALVAIFIWLMYRFIEIGNDKGAYVVFITNLLMLTEAPFETSKPAFILFFLFSLFAFEKPLQNINVKV